MGKVRVKIGGTYAERFAKSKNPDQSIQSGTNVRVVDVTDECLWVEKE